MKIGFIGLGIMGKPMAMNLLKAGYVLNIIQKQKKSVEELSSAGAVLCKSVSDLTMNSDVIITMLPNSPEVEEVLLGDDGVIQYAQKETIVIDMSSISPIASRKIYAAFEEKGLELLDAPVSGGEPKAIEGTLAVMVGGKKEIFDKCSEIMQVMAATVTYIGESGAGNVAKLCNQIIVALNISAVSEAMVLAQKAGVNPQIVYEAIRSGLAGSAVLDAKFPMMIDHTFEPGFKIDLHIKDLTNVMETSHNVGVPLPMTAQIMEIMQAVKFDGCGDKDHSSIIKFYEKIGNVTVSE